MSAMRCSRLLLAVIFLSAGQSFCQETGRIRPPQSPATALGAAEGLPSETDLRPMFQQLGLAPRLQGGRPTCSVFTVANALEFAVGKRQGRTPRLSVEFLNWAANKQRGENNDGGFFSDLWKGFASWGICAEEDMPYQPGFDPKRTPDAQTLANAKTRRGLGLRINWIKEWNVNTGLTDAEFQGVKHTLAQGWPVCGGFRWPKQERWEKDVLQMCAADAVRDGHSVLLVGYRDQEDQPGGGVFIFRNTGGRGRDGQMPYAYAKLYMNDAVWVNYESRTDR
jgi:papain like protease